MLQLGLYFADLTSGPSLPSPPQGMRAEPHGHPSWKPPSYRYLKTVGQPASAIDTNDDGMRNPIEIVLFRAFIQTEAEVNVPNMI